jgi:hypothetical protein
MVWRYGSFARKLSQGLLVSNSLVACGRINYAPLEAQAGAVDADVNAVDASTADAVKFDADPSCLNTLHEDNNSVAESTDMGSLLLPYTSPTLAICPATDIDILSSDIGGGILTLDATLVVGNVDDLRVRVYDGAQTLLATSIAQTTRQVVVASVPAGKLVLMLDSPTAQLSEYDLNVVLAAGS